MIRRIVFIIAVIIPLLGAGCAQTVLDTAKDAAVKGAQKTNQFMKESGEGYFRNLSDEEKKVIDEWLSANELNKYGDSSNTVYAGGTPLFNEATGESRDRFEYLFEKFPDLKDVVKYEIDKKDAMAEEK
ncbi:MAG: hypothetical protein COU72_02130 [Parcubacteria group bacterium CG10_big_fil_rev_8_21_14_0_10_41_35]|nr:MAG: hypothetical protein COU72_02130 [Parcubacteria group bacterium CG10_big_fil_rev_8_21_14_0_10_41_35]PIZ81591.1 MAG: hypothetical protein COY02_01195 [Parcubacteria group bacterium CG_4_10_14_0_2_um_filter_41_6]